MKGIIFTEFIEMVENVFGLEVADQILETADLPSGGVYTAVGTYDHKEMVELVTHLSKATNVAVKNLLEKFGEHAFGIFVKAYPHFFEKPKDSFSFLEGIEGYIHPEVLKIYPEAELPKFETEISGNTMVMTYHSVRKMGDFARGLIMGCLAHFKEEAEIVTSNIEEDGSIVQFTISK